MFLGANMDAVKEAESIGIARGFATNYEYSAKGVCDTFATMSCAATSIRGDALSSDFDLTTAYNICSNDNK
jgi:hypothetical protein